MQKRFTASNKVFENREFQELEKVMNENNIHPVIAISFCATLLGWKVIFLNKINNNLPGMVIAEPAIINDLNDEPDDFINTNEIGRA